MRYILTAITLLSFLLLPANHRLMSTGDDDDYFAVAAAIAYGKFPSFSDEYHIGRKMPFASVGPGLMAAPFVAIFSLGDRAAKSPIVEKRDKGNRYWTWSLLGFHFAAYVYLLVGVLFLYEALKAWGSRHAAALSTVLILLGGGGILIYVFRRPVMSHVFEFFAVALGVLLATREIKGNPSRWQSELIGICAALIFLTRYNNVFIAVGLIACHLYVVWIQTHLKFFGQALRVFIPFGLLIFLFRILPIFANGYSSYDQGYGGVLGRLIPEIDPLFYWNRVGEIFLGHDMGLVYTAPILIVALIALWQYRVKLPREILFLTGLALFNFYFAIIWKSFGSYYGYRYIIFSALPLLSIPLTLLIDDLFSAIGKFRVVLFGLALCYLPLMSILAFERSGKYGFIRVTNSYGIETYTQPNFHTNLLTDLLSNPVGPVIRAAATGFASFFWGELSSQQVIQRVILYFLPPLLLLPPYWYFRNKSRVAI